MVNGLLRVQKFCIVFAEKYRKVWKIGVIQTKIIPECNGYDIILDFFSF